MEVHHPHHPTHKKKWSEYIIEFIMLFTAVTLGFFAENIREELLIKHQTKSVLAQLHHELILDTIQIKTVEIQYNKNDTVSEFISFLIKQNQLEEYKASFHLLNIYIQYRQKFNSNSIALEQLKYSGFLKSVSDDSLRYDIENYFQAVKGIENGNERQSLFMDKYIDDIGLYPFDLNKSYDEKVKGLDSEKGELIKNRDVFCNNIKINLSFQPTFIPDHIVLKTFDKKKYLNIIYKLKLLRDGILNRQYIPAYNKAVKLLQSIEKAYPDIKE